MRREPDAFTLIELMAVLLLMALLAAAATLSLRGVLRPASIQQTLERIAQMQQLMRQHCRNKDTSEQLVVDLDQGTLRRMDSEHQQPVGLPLRLSDMLSITQVRTILTTTTAGQISLPCSNQGYCPTWAFCLHEQGSSPRWVLVLGISGQRVELSDEKEMEQTWQLLSSQSEPSGPDAG